MIGLNRQVDAQRSGDVKEINPDVEITQEMIEAGVNALSGHFEMQPFEDCNEDAVIHCFKAMLMASNTGA